MATLLDTLQGNAAVPASAATRPAGASFAPSPALYRTVLFATVLVAVAAAILAGHGTAAPAVDQDADLARLLRLMAAIKGAMALAALGLLAWRFGHPLRPATAASYVAAGTLMAAGPVLMWQITPLVAGAVMFHAGLVMLLVLGWKDDEADGRRGVRVLRWRGSG